MFEDRVAIITGASSGLGRHLALRLASRGAKLVLSARRREKLESVRREISERTGKKPGKRAKRASVLTGDVTVEEDCRDVIQHTLHTYGSLDFLITAAGVSMWKRFEEIEDLSTLERIMDVNYMGTVRCLKPALPHLRESGGSFVAISSIQGKVGAPFHTGYAASKHAIQGFCNSLRMEYESGDFHIMTVLPHWIGKTELRQNAIGNPPRRDRKQSANALDPGTCCDAIINGIRREKREVILPFKVKLLSLLYAIAPGMADSIIKGRVRNEQDRSG